MNEELEQESKIQYAVTERNKIPEDHYLIWEDGVAVCTSCDFKHTMSISPEKYDLIDGKAVIKFN